MKLTVFELLGASQGALNELFNAKIKDADKILEISDFQLEVNDEIKKFQEAGKKLVEVFEDKTDSEEFKIEENKMLQKEVELSDLSLNYEDIKECTFSANTISFLRLTKILPERKKSNEKKEK
jgi:predicted membrane-bound dolichyl-phosphate-mannose-protein mannosyltransferase